MMTVILSYLTKLVFLCCKVLIYILLSRMGKRNESLFIIMNILFEIQFVNTVNYKFNDLLTNIIHKIRCKHNLKKSNINKN